MKLKQNSLKIRNNLYQGEQIIDVDWLKEDFIFDIVKVKNLFSRFFGVFSFLDLKNKIHNWNSTNDLFCTCNQL